MEKESNNTWLWLAGIIGVVYLFGSRTLAGIKCRLVSLIPVSITETQIKINLGIQIYNPTGVRVLLGKVDADFYINSQNVGGIYYSINRYIQPKAVSNINIQVTIDKASISATLWNQIQTGYLLNMDFDFVGTVEANRAFIPVNLHFIAEDFKL